MIHGGADRVCTEANGDGDPGFGSLSQAGRERADLLALEWKKQYGGLGVLEIKRLKLLEEENRRLKQLVADLSLDKVFSGPAVTLT